MELSARILFFCFNAMKGAARMAASFPARRMCFGAVAKRPSTCHSRARQKGGLSWI